MSGRDSWGVWDGYVHTAVFLMDNQQHRELCSMLCDSLYGIRSLGENGYMYMCG